MSFKEWLINIKEYRSKSASDIVSRLKRCQKYKVSNMEEDLELQLFQLERNPEFKELSQSVKSQLKRSFKLFHAYRQSINYSEMHG